ncbi:MAG: efflux RND transporter periplasmic adaptor subunit [Planctomycetota bacterium]
MTLKVAGTFWVLLAGAVLPGCPSSPPSSAPRTAPKVTVAHPEIREIVDQDEYNGWMDAVATVEVRARVRGHIQEVHFPDGQFVREGDLLFTLDPRPFQAEVDQARDQLRVYEAQKVAADRELVRLRELLGKGGASQSQVDKAEADVGSLDAQIEGAKQEIERHNLDLEYSRITAPISGKISRALLSAGNLVNAGGSDPLLTTIVAMDPIYVYFNIGEHALQRYMQMRPKDEPPKELRERQLPFFFGLDADEGYPHQGTLDFAENRVDRQTGTIQVRGAVPNPDGVFVPGSRARVRVPVSQPYRSTLVPDTAILTDQDRKYLLVVGAQNVVLRRDVQLGRLLDDGMRIVLPATKEGAGVTAEDWVITLGLQRARVNYPVEPLDAAGKPVGLSGPSPGGPTLKGPSSGSPASPAGEKAPQKQN